MGVKIEMSMNRLATFHKVGPGRGEHDGEKSFRIGSLIGPLNHSRWLTHATRIERLLLSTNPDEPFYSNLVLLATYITAIYFTGHMDKVPQRDRKTSNLHRLEREKTTRDRTRSKRRQETNSSATWILPSLLTTRPTLKG